jgi:hypothetical protein
MNVRNPIMMLITKPQYEKLLAGGQRNMEPVIKLFGGPITWLVTGIDEAGILWGYGDISQGYVEFGTLCHVSELPTLKCGIGFIERDYYFTHKPGTKYLGLESLSGI